MNYYEMLCVLPGTLSEEEVAPIVEKIQEIIEKQDGIEVKIYDMGKSRLAYPVKHIRYGYFRLVYFQSEPGRVKEIETKLRMISELLRIIIKSSKPGDENKDRQESLDPQNKTFTQEKVEREEKEGKGQERRGFKRDDRHQSRERVSPAAVKEEKEDKEVEEVKENVEVKEDKKESTSAKATEDKEVKEAKKEEKVEEVVKEDKKPTISIDDIDAKLDEILQKDLDKA